MRIALAQINPTVGDMGSNTNKIISIIRSINADIIAFPELSITGYSPQDLLLNPNFVEKNIDALKKIMQAVKNKAAIVGFIDRENESLYNSAAVIINGDIAAIHHKLRLPNYTIFDEKRWFKEGAGATIFELDGKNIGVSICEDIWFPETSKAQKEKGAELLINISASPYSSGKFEAVEKTIMQRWEENELPIIYVNQAGAQDGIVYYGRSMYFKDGRVIKKCRDFEEDILVVEA